jgi:hypothetical protein
MKSTLLATVAVAALAIGGSMASAQERNGADMKAQQAPAASAPAQGAESQPNAAKPAPRSAQAEHMNGAAQQGQPAEQRRAAEEKRPDATRPGVAEQDKSKQQAQQERKEPSRAAAGQQRDTGKAQASEEQGQKSRSSAAADQNRNAAQAQQKPTASKEQMKSGAAASEPNRNNASTAQDKGARQPDRMGANERNPAPAARGGSEDVNVTGSIPVDRQKATRVHDELIRTAPKTNIDISVNVGTALPGRVHVRPVPASIISISPEFRGYDYVVVRDEIVIVEPRTRKVVTVIESSGRAHRPERASLTLSATQRDRIRGDIRMDQVRDFDVQVQQGRAIPQTVVLEPLPDVVLTSVPEVRDYRYFVDDHRIVIVDPDTREVIDIIQ